MNHRQLSQRVAGAVPVGADYSYADRPTELVARIKYLVRTPYRLPSITTPSTFFFLFSSPQPSDFRTTQQHRRKILNAL